MNLSSDLAGVVKTYGYRLTRQRRLVLEILRENQEHLEADAVFALAKSRDPGISLATVYRSLALFKQIGLVEEDRLGQDHGHFEAVQGARHYHFTCLKCGRVVEFEAPELNTILQNLSGLEGLRVTEIRLNLRGYCPDCDTDPEGSIG
jgi:Fe2+ or Zn2+ uptake regulation protein